MKSPNVLIMRFDWSVSQICEETFAICQISGLFLTQKIPKSLPLIRQKYFKNINTNCDINRPSIHINISETVHIRLSKCIIGTYKITLKQLRFKFMNT